MKFKIFFIIFIFLISLNVSGYEVKILETEIFLKDNILTVKDTILIEGLGVSDKVFFQTPSFNNFKLEGKYGYFDYTYKEDFLTIQKIDCKDCCIQKDKIIFDVFYLTEVYLFEEINGVYKLRYNPIFNNYTESFTLYIPNNKRIINFSEDFSKIEVLDDLFIVSLENLSSLDLDYIIERKEGATKYQEYSIFLFFIILLVIYVFYIRNLYKNKKYL